MAQFGQVRCHSPGRRAAVLVAPNGANPTWRRVGEPSAPGAVLVADPEGLLAAGDLARDSRRNEPLLDFQIQWGPECRSSGDRDGSACTCRIRSKHEKYGWWRMSFVLSLIAFVAAMWMLPPHLAHAASGVYLSSELGANFSPDLDTTGTSNDRASALPSPSRKPRDCLYPHP